MSNTVQLKFNDPAPDLTLLDGNGKPTKLSSLWKNGVLINKEDVGGAISRTMKLVLAGGQVTLKTRTGEAPL